ncbi:MAG: lipopolysaccharide biosynthesis protein [Lachnospiraceae bacterium]|nr:lipopolysaccharide biosynthesis protein [Lachnospiraceae bacterium]
MKSFLNNSNNIERDSYIWNMAGSMIMAFQSVILLIILTRVVDIVTAGVFTIANANANLFLNIGRFGMRNYQVSDVRREYNFAEYRNSRVASTILMFVCFAAYIAYAAISNGYSAEKTWIIFWMCMFKLPDAFEDVYYGEYQRNGRLDIASKAMTIRVTVTIIFFAGAVIVTKDLLWSMIASTIFTVILMVYLLVVTADTVKDREKTKAGALKKLLVACFPVFASSFLAYYIGNAPKYAIDSQLSDELQAIYGFLSMPVFVIGLLNNFIFNPILFSVSCLWQDGKLKEFKRAIVRQTLIVGDITVVCIAGAFVLGIPVLSILYNTDLTDYKAELLLLLVGGGLLGASGVYTVILTIMRQQNALMIGYLIVAAMAMIFSGRVVASWGMMGAVWLYNGLMLFLCLIFVLMMWGYMKKAPRMKEG